MKKCFQKEGFKDRYIDLLSSWEEFYSGKVESFQSHLNYIFMAKFIVGKLGIRAWGGG